MKLWTSFRTLLAYVLRRSRVEHEMEEELRSHLDSRADDLERRGLSRAEADRQARVEFGGYERYKEECREALGSRLVGEVVGDARHGNGLVDGAPLTFHDGIPINFMTYVEGRFIYATYDHCGSFQLWRSCGNLDRA